MNLETWKLTLLDLTGIVNIYQTKADTTRFTPNFSFTSCFRCAVMCTTNHHLESIVVKHHSSRTHTRSKKCRCTRFFYDWCIAGTCDTAICCFRNVVVRIVVSCIDTDSMKSGYEVFLESCAAEQASSSLVDMLKTDSASEERPHAQSLLREGLFTSDHAREVIWNF